jgi:hypothetical protein
MQAAKLSRAMAETSPLTCPMKEIVDARNGKIDVRNNINKGTTFTFIFLAFKNLSLN